MEAYEKLGSIGEGTYGMVMKCRQRETGQIVAIKKFKESEDDLQIRKTALREVRMLKQLKNDNIVNLLDVFRRKGKLYLVFEHVDHTILEDLDKAPHGLSDDIARGDVVRKCMWQLLKAVDYLHSHNVIHRDIKPENILVSLNGVLKLCDFGFARTLAGPGAKYTDYVATRWYRAPELLVGDTEYGKAVDIWATGCIFAEILTGQPLFPGDTDIDQLYRIIKCLGKLNKRHMDVFLKNPLFVGGRIPEVNKVTPLESKLPHISAEAMSWLRSSLLYDPDQRATTRQLMQHTYFCRDDFVTKFEVELKHTIEMERERDQADKIRRKKSKKHTFFAHGSKKDVRLPLEELENPSKRIIDEDGLKNQSTIPPINNQGKPHVFPGYNNFGGGMTGMGVVAGSNGSGLYGGGNNVNTQNNLALSNGTLTSNDRMMMVPSTPNNYGYNKKKNQIYNQNTVSFPKIGFNNGQGMVRGYGVNGNNFMGNNNNDNTDR
ncbi:Cyclin-dependent kinase-like 3 [Lobulomyces angularis]|nr:Cyclin-dependent kinase-like 3 [Lobulomyces angularis]